MKKFKDAFNGIKLCLKDKAIKIQIFLGICAIIGGFIIKLDIYEWLAFVICIGVVIAAEVNNSCVEKLCDLYKEEYDIRIKVIKDMASAFVLICAIMSFVVCLLVVLRRIII